jgi:ATP phosphoribosyltransferase regulatory subunit
VVFDAYCEGVVGAVARGGRYDEVGKSFGRLRPATGFSIDLRSLAAASGTGRARKRGAGKRSR